MTKLMRLTKKKVFPALFILILLFSFVQKPQPSVQATIDVSEKIFKPTVDYIIGLEILNDTDFETLNFEGDGSAATPYIIKDYNFSDPQVRIGIYISNTSKHCLITNCTFVSQIYGISLLDASNVAVTNNILSYCPTGFTISNCLDVEVIKNSFSSYHQTAVKIVDTPNILVEDNFISLPSIRGIELDNCPNSVVNNNTIMGGHANIYVIDSPGTAITNNNCTWGGISFDSSDYRLEEYLSYISINNTLDSKNIGFFKSINKLEISGNYSQLILVNCSDVEISDLEFAGCSTGIKAFYGENIDIHDCNFTYNYYEAIALLFVENSLIYSNQISLNPSSETLLGIVLYNCSNCGVQGNLISKCSYGLLLIKTDLCVVADNICTESFMAAILLDSANRSLIIGNECIRTNYFGSAGIIIRNSLRSTITENNVSRNSRNGISLENAHSNTITKNSIIHNSLYGIRIDEYSTDNVIYWNEFEDNYPRGVLDGQGQAFDSGINNTWYSKDLKEGNFWDDHSSRKPYGIDGDANSQDLYPLRNSPFETSLIIPFLNICFTLIVINRIRKSVKK